MSSVWKDCGHEVSGTEQECLYCRIEELQFELSSYEESDANLQKKVKELEAILENYEGYSQSEIDEVLKQKDESHK